jgi:hypothetical protein
MALINLLGGTAVLGSYIHGLRTHPANRVELWGDVPQSVQSPYVFWMFVAAGGYLFFTYYLFFVVDAEKARVGRQYGFGIFNVLYLCILVPSALWMPLTFEMVERPSQGLWLAVRLTLWIAGAASLALVIALVWLRPRQPARAYWLAVAGSVAFAIQTALVDAVIWTVFFPA